MLEALIILCNYKNKNTMSPDSFSLNSSLDTTTTKQEPFKPEGGGKLKPRLPGDRETLCLLSAVPAGSESQASPVWGRVTDTQATVFHF